MTIRIETAELGRLNTLLRRERLPLAINTYDATRPDSSRNHVTFYIPDSDGSHFTPTERLVLQDLLHKLTNAEWEYSRIQTGRGQTGNVLHAQVESRIALEIAERFGESNMGLGFRLPNRMHLSTEAGDLTPAQIWEMEEAHREAQALYASTPDNADYIPPVITANERRDAPALFEDMKDAPVLPLSQMSVMMYVSVANPGLLDGYLKAKSSKTPPPRNPTAGSLEKTGPIGPPPGTGDVSANEIVPTLVLGRPNPRSAGS